MRSLGVDVRLEPAPANSPTARCHVLISDDGQRTMQTYLGACTELSVTDVTDNTVGSPAVILLEGYIWDLVEEEQLFTFEGHTDWISSVAFSPDGRFLLLPTTTK